MQGNTSKRWWCAPICSWSHITILARVRSCSSSLSTKIIIVIGCDCKKNVYSSNNIFTFILSCYCNSIFTLKHASYNPYLSKYTFTVGTMRWWYSQSGYSGFPLCWLWTNRHKGWRTMQAMFQYCDQNLKSQPHEVQIVEGTSKAPHLQHVEKKSYVQQWKLHGLSVKNWKEGFKIWKSTLKRMVWA